MLFATEVDAPGVAALERVVLDAERAGYAFVTFPDTPRRPGIEAGVRAAYLARRTTRIGLAPTLHATTTEPFHLATQLASLDHASLGRAGWVVGATTAAEDLATVGRTGAGDGEVADVVEVARRLWDSWEDDAIIRDVATGRFLDPRKVHHVDFEGSGFSVVGPLITPRPPQGQVVVIGSDELTAVLDVALDVALVRATDVAEIATRVAAARAAGAALVFADVPASFDPSLVEGLVDGVHFHGGPPPVITASPHGATLRETLGLPRPLNRFAVTS
ncbi:LLM class flavin-dependent oxidoreductase [Dactylosporangium sp. NPDC005555]|uniref:LLM class flavin-dependent oxidoreductase n=1 Tax=Dactylosporangium sp. NPDC005555 TaxID=3154889 RepID=UPI00339E7A17